MQQRPSHHAGSSLDTIDMFADTDRASAIDAIHAATAIYTAGHVVDDLLDALDWPRDGRLLADPGCGDGAFLKRALQRLLNQQPEISDSGILDTLEGWEIHPVAAAQSRAQVTSVLMGHGRTRAEAVAVAMRMVRNADFLTAGPTHPRYHALVGNPPFLRFTNIPQILRDEYQATLPRHACADILHSFLDRCSDRLLPQGEIAFITSDRWLSNVNASKLRAAIGARLDIHHLRRLDVKTSFYQPKTRRKGTPPRVHPVAVVLRAPGQDSVRLTAAPLYPDVDVAPGGQPRGGMVLGDIATVTLSPWLGGRGIFVVDEQTARTLPPDCLVPAIDSVAIRGGQLNPPRLFAIRTRPDVEPPAAILAHLRANIGRMASRGRRRQWWVPPETWHGLDLGQPTLLVPRIARSISPVRIGVGLLAINHNLSIAAIGQTSLDEVEAILSSKAANRWMQDHAARLEGGFFSVTAKLLRQLPIPENAELTARPKAVAGSTPGSVAGGSKKG